MPSAVGTYTMVDTSGRKRPHADEGTPRKSKKAKESKKHGDEEIGDNSTEETPKKSKKDRKERKDDSEKKDSEHKEKKSSKKDKRDKKEKKDKIKTSASQELDSSDASSKEPVFPFYTQTVSLWVPLYPLGFDKPITSAATQHLAGLVDHYAPQLGGYLLGFRNVNLSDKAQRANPKNPPTDATPATLTCVDEYAVGFGWMTADVDLFVPSRGAWLEGSVILQNEGAVGVSCWDKFNASIEAARLPKGWKYVELEDAGSMAGEQAAGAAGEEAAEAEADDTEAMDTAEDGETTAAAAAAGGGRPDADTESVAPLQSTGYWVDADGMPVEGKIRFRIKDFDVGLAGDNGYIAIEGTMLDADEERALRVKERARYASKGNGVHGHKTRRLPEFSITQFGKEDEEEESGRRVELYKGSRPGTPDD